MAIIMIEKTRSFRPDWISPPGDTIADLLEERDWTQADLANRMGNTTKFVSQLINGKATISEETALKLESVFGSTAAFWLNREAQYRENLSRLEENERLKTWIPWAEQFPIKDLIKSGVIEKRWVSEKQKPAIVKDLLRFFGIASPEGWKLHYEQMPVAFRRTRKEQSDMGAIWSWLRLGEVEAEKMNGPKFDKNKFEKALKTIRTFTNLSPEEFLPRMRRLCIDSGVSLVLIPAIPRAHVSGVARWLNPHKALIQMSLYGKTNDRFWFTFFHEAAHILKQDKKGVFLDEFDGQRLDSSYERDADKWASDFLIPPECTAELPSLRSKESVKTFASKIGVHPGIVVGRMQHEELITHKWMNGLKVSYRFKAKGNA